MDATILLGKEPKVFMERFYLQKTITEKWLLWEAYIFEGKKQMKSVGSIVTLLVSHSEYPKDKPFSTEDVFSSELIRKI